MNNVLEMKAAVHPLEIKLPHESEIFQFFVPTTFSITQDVIVLIMLPIMFRPYYNFFRLAQKMFLKCQIENIKTIFFV